MKIIEIEINKIKPIIPLKFVENCSANESFYPIIVNKDFFVIDGHKKLKQLLKSKENFVRVLVIEKEKNEAFLLANKHRPLTIFEQYTLYKNGVDIKISGLIPRDYDVLEKLDFLKQEDLELLIEQKINSKNVISVLFLTEEKQEFLFKILNKLELTNNEIRGFLDNLIHLSPKDLQEFLDINEKNDFILSFYKKAKPFIFRNNETIKKINVSLPSKTTIRENTSFELGDFELNLNFLNYEDLKTKVEKLSKVIETEVAKQQLNSLGE